MTSPLRPAAAAATTCLLLLFGCGAASTPAEAVPELAKALTAVDDALAQQLYPQAGRQLRRLVATAEDARAAGDLEQGEADRVLAAAAKLLAALPTAAAQPLPGSDATSVPSPEPEGVEDAPEDAAEPDDAGRDDAGPEDAEPEEDEGGPDGEHGRGNGHGNVHGNGRGR